MFPQVSMRHGLYLYLCLNLTGATNLDNAANYQVNQDFADASSDVQLILFDMQPLYNDMRTQGPEAYGMKSFLFSLISDWVPAYGYAWVKDDNSSLLPTSPVEDIYGYGYTYKYNDGYYSRPDEASYNPEDYLFYDEYHLSETGQQWRAAYMLGLDVGAADYSVYQGQEVSSIVTSGIADMTFDQIVVFGASGSDTCQANKVTKELVANRR